MALAIGGPGPSPEAKGGRASVGLAIDLVQGDFKHGGAVAGHRPTAHPAPVLVVVYADHLIKVLITSEVNTVTLMEAHRWGE
jgi:hypothetical protein